MANAFTAKHDPPIESIMVRTVFFGGYEDEARMWKLLEQFSENGALPSATYGLLMIGVDSMVYHHSTSENEKGQRSVVVSILGSPLLFVCDEAAIKAKPFNQQAHDYQLMMMRRQGFEPCPTCYGAGNVYSQAQSCIQVCGGCEGRGFVPYVPKPKPQEPAPSTNPEWDRKVERLMAETGSSKVECEIALKNRAGDYDKALKWMDDSRLGGGS